MLYVTGVIRRVFNGRRVCACVLGEKWGVATTRRRRVSKIEESSLLFVQDQRERERGRTDIIRNKMSPQLLLFIASFFSFLF